MSEREPTQTDFFKEIKSDQGEGGQDQQLLVEKATTNPPSLNPREDPAKARKRDSSFAARWRR